MSTKTKSSTLVVGKNIIFQIIKRQAGTLSKAVMECVMNSVDAGAKNIEITMDNAKLVIKDDGRGFKTEEEIDECFNVFGFDHTNMDRMYGEFGIGRGQLWNFCSTIWRTNTFSMDVDIKKKGLDYIIKSGLSDQKGLEIIGKFYERKTLSEINDFKLELTEMVKYLDIEITLNGEKINIGVGGVKWDFETDEAYFKIQTKNNYCYLYNMGVLVKPYSSGVMGSGGIIVTKPNVRLKLNMARNDVIVSDCTMWKKISKDYKKFADEIMGNLREKREALTAGRCYYITQKMLSENESLEKYKDEKIFQNIKGTRYGLMSLFSKMNEGKFCFAKKGDIVIDKLHALKDVFAINDHCFEYFGLYDDNEDIVLDKFVILFSNLSKILRYFDFNEAKFRRNFVTVSSLKQGFNESYDIILPNKYTPLEKVIIETFKDVEVPYRLVGDLREIRIGQSETANAWTDGKHYICFDRKFLTKVKNGYVGINRLLHVLMHEYAHDHKTEGSHVHSNEFYERYHDLTMSDEFQQFTATFYRRFIKVCFKMGVGLTSNGYKDLEHLEKERELMS